MARIKIGDLLVKAGLIDEMQLQAGLAHQRQWGGKLGDALVANGFVDEMMLWKGLSRQLGVPLVSLPEHPFPPGIERVVPLDLCRKHSIVPMTRDSRELVVASSEPNNIAGIDEVAFRVGARLRVVLAPDREVEWAMRRLYHGDMAPCPQPKLRRVLAEVDPATAMAVTTARGPIVDFTGRAPAMHVDPAPAAYAGPPPSAAAQPGLPAYAAVPTAPVPTAPVPTAPVPTAPVPTASVPPAPAPTSPVPQVMNPFATGAAAPAAVPWASPGAPAGTAAASSPGPAFAMTSSTMAQTEATLRETSALLRFVVEACIARGVFTREEYVERVRAQP